MQGANLNLWGDVVCWPAAKCMSQADEVLPDSCQLKLRWDSNPLTLVSIVPSTIKSKTFEYTIVQAKFYLRASCHFHPNTRILQFPASSMDAQFAEMLLNINKYKNTREPWTNKPTYVTFKHCHFLLYS